MKKGLLLFTHLSDMIKLSVLYLLSPDWYKVGGWVEVKKKGKEKSGFILQPPGCFSLLICFIISFLVCETSLELRSKTALQHSPKQLKRLETGFKLKWIHTAHLA